MKKCPGRKRCMKYFRIVSDKLILDHENKLYVNILLERILRSPVLV